MPKKLNAKIPRALYRQLLAAWHKNDAKHGVTFEQYLVGLLKKVANKR